MIKMRKLMRKEVRILLTVSDEEDAALIHENLRRAGIYNPITRFSDGRELLDFLLKNKIEADEYNRTNRAGEIKSYLLLLDLKMPGLSGVEVIQRLKAGEAFEKVSVIVMTGPDDDPDEIEKCRRLNCGNFIAKPVAYEKFVEVIKKLGFFLVIVEVSSPELVPGPFDGKNAEG
jgi:CheY-like chemotaxis protein